MSDIATTQGLMSRFSTIGKTASNVLQRLEEITDSDSERYEEVVGSIMTSYTSALKDFKSLKPIPGLTLESVASYVISYVANQRGVLTLVAVNSETAMGYLRNLYQTIPPDDNDKLEQVRKKTEDLQHSSPNLIKHLLKAVDEYESGHFMASAIIASKVCIWGMEAIPGKDDAERASWLVNNGSLPKDLETTFLKGIRSARNYFTHDINAIPEAEDALGLISDAFNLSLKLDRMAQAV